MRRSTAIAIILLALARTADAQIEEADFYVRPVPYGNDANDGLSPDTAVATLARARDVVRAYRASLPNEQDISFIVNVGGGVYELPDMFILESIDSGVTSKHPMIYRAANLGDPLGATAIISGGTKVTNWDLNGGLYQASWTSTIPLQRPRDLYRSSGGYQEGARLVRARFPNIPPVFSYDTVQWLKIANQTQVSGTSYWKVTVDTSDTCYTTSSIPQDGSATDSGVEIVTRRNWIAPRQSVLVSVPYQWTGTEVFMLRKLGSVTTNLQIISGNEFYLEGAAEWADVEGEWACTITTGGDKLNIKSATDPDTSIMVAPRLLTLVRLDRAFNVSFENLIFCYSDRPKLQYGYNTVGSGHAIEDMPEAGFDRGDEMLPGALELFGTQYCVLSGCSVLHTGGHGIVIQSHLDGTTWTFANTNLVIDCQIKDLGGCGLYIGNLKDPFQYGHAGNMWPDVVAAWVRHTTVAECVITGFGAAYHDCPGIQLRKTDDAVISHNEIASLSGTVDPLNARYSGIIASSFNQSDYPHCHATTLEYNHIHHVMSRLADGAGIYVNGYHPDSIIRGNWVHAMPRDPRYVQNCLVNPGLYFDLGSRGFYIEDNLLEAIGNYDFNPTNPYCPTVPGGCPEPSRVGTLQFNTRATAAALPATAGSTTTAYRHAPSRPRPCPATKPGPTGG